MLNFFRKKTPEPAVKAPEPAKKSHMGRPFYKRLFESATFDRLTDDWTSTPLSADAIISRNLRTLVARSREQAVNNDYAKAFIRKCKQNIVGSKGVLLQAKIKKSDKSLDTEANQALEKAWKDWGKRKNCDIKGMRSWIRIQQQAIISTVLDGEFFIKKIYGTDGGKYRFCLQILDAQRCPSDYDRFDMPGDVFIRAGIEYNKHGKPLAYHFQTSDDKDPFFSYSYGQQKYNRIPADEIIHGFVDDIINQKRGLPWMATSLYRMRHLAGFENAAVVNARVGASKMGFVQWEDGKGPALEENEDLFIEASPASIVNLPDGATFKDWSPQYPSNEFAVFTKSMLRGMASGLGIAYNNLASDLEGVNYSSIRHGELDEREHWKDLQEWLIETLIEPVYEEWVERAVLSSKITYETGLAVPPQDIDKLQNVAWQPRRWQWIDPNNEIEAMVKSKNNLLQSVGSIIREQGGDPSEVYAEIADDYEQMKASGLPEMVILSAIMGNNFQTVMNNQEPKNETTKKSI